MAATVALRTRLEGIAKVQQGLKQLSKSIESVGEKASRAGTALSLKLSAPLALVGGASVKMAMDAIESENLFEVAMGDMADAAREFSEKLRRELGLNAFEVRKNVSTFFQMFDAMGIGKQAALDMATGLTQLTNDLASFFNLSPEDAFLKLQSAISGEIEPLRRLGVLVDENTIKQVALRHGIIRSGQELSAQQKVIARYIAIVEQTRNAQGDLARTLDSPTNRMRIMRQQVVELGIQLGQALLPAMQAVLNLVRPLVQRIREAADAFAAMSASQQIAITAAVALVAALGPLLKVFGTLATVGRVVLSVLAAFATVKGLVIAAIVAIVAAVGVAAVTIVRNWDLVKLKTERAWLGVKLAALEAMEAIVRKIASLRLLPDAFRNIARKSAEGFQQEIARVRGRRVALDIAINQSTFESPKKLFADMVDSMKAKWNAFVARIKGGGDKATAEAAASIQAEMQAKLEQLAATAKKMTATTEAAAKKAHDLALKRIDLEIRLGKKTLEDKLRFLQKSLQAVKKGTAREIQIRNQILDVAARMAQRDIERITGLTDITEEEALRQLEIEREKYAAMGEAGVEAVRKIEEAMARLRKQQEDSGQTIKGAWQRATEGIKGAWEQMFVDIFTGAKNFGQALRNFWKSVVNQLLSALAKWVASKLWDLLMSRLKNVERALNSVARAKRRAGFGGFLTKVGSVLSFVPGLNVVGGAISAIGSVIGGGGGGIGGIFNIARSIFGFQSGGEISVSRPTLFAAGEVGPERVRVEPLTARRQRGTTNVQFNAPVILDGITARQFARIMMEEMQRESLRFAG